MVIYTNTCNLNATRPRHLPKPIRRPADLTNALSDEEKERYRTLNLEEKDGFLRDLLPRYLKAKGVDLNRPITCPDPAHLDCKPSASFDKDGGRTVKCWSCDTLFSIYDLAWLDFLSSKEHRLMRDSDLPIAKRKVEELFGLRTPSATPDSVKASSSTPPSTKPTSQPKPAKPAIPPHMEMQCELPLYAPHEIVAEKWLTRGIRLNWPGIKPFNLGYSEVLDMLIVPCAPGWFGRRVTPERSPKAHRPAGIPAMPFNYAALYAGDVPVVVCEGEIDALSVMQVPPDSFNGGVKPQAIGLGGINQINKLLTIIDGLPREQRANLRLVLLLDNDEPGRKAAKELAEQLEARGIRHWYPEQVLKDFKDPNEYLMADWMAFHSLVRALCHSAYEHMAEPAELPPEKEDVEDSSESVVLETPEEYLQNTSLLGFMPDFRRVLNDPDANPVRSTGISIVDQALGDGLRNELHILGAVSSLGKTTLVHQICDNLAKQGTDVLFFELEQSREELLRKSLSRLDFLSEQRVLDTGEPLTIGNLIHWAGDYHTEGEQTRLAMLLRAYETDYAPRMFVQQADGALTAQDVYALVKKHQLVTKRVPVVIIDYLQCLGAPPDSRWDTKRVVDFSVSELKRVSRDFATPVVALSSLNRANYVEKISMQSFKESGAVEYGCDILLGMQLKGLANLNASTAIGKRLLRAMESAVDSQKAAGKELALELRVLKNRNGIQGAYDIAFNPRNSYFHPNPDLLDWIEAIVRFLPSSLSISNPELELFLTSVAGRTLSDEYLDKLSRLPRFGSDAEDFDIPDSTFKDASPTSGSVYTIPAD